MELFTNLQEQLDVVKVSVKETGQEMAMCKKAITGGAVVTPSPRVDVPKPKEFGGKRDAKELDNFLWHIYGAQLRSLIVGPTQEGKTWEWSKRCQTAFEGLKEAVTEEPVLVLPDHGKILEVQTDVSNFAIGGVLMQEGHPIAFESRKLNDTKRTYTMQEKKMTAVIRGVSFDHMLRSITDDRDMAGLIRVDLLQVTAEDGQVLVRDMLRIEYDNDKWTDPSKLHEGLENGLKMKIYSRDQKVGIKGRSIWMRGVRNVTLMGKTLMGYEVLCLILISFSNIFHEKSYGSSNRAVSCNDQPHYLIGNLGLRHELSSRISRNNHVGEYILHRRSGRHGCLLLLDHLQELLPNSSSSFGGLVKNSTRDVGYDRVHTHCDIIKMVHKPSDALRVVDAHEEAARERQSDSL
ncbi:hypothetical protein RJ639_031211 [Escallonia herrerae]|uniref:Reverse transcriptase/retrotransposon-derived protein RNase H-like domain-containing protein n=1 Tax=Escallonia herrerae TaxID=1293975 RepID=A0AA88WZX8_9ASTE|nr:hypothetical protein RJ639_031211 [Escallonia herrerae]